MPAFVPKLVCPPYHFDIKRNRQGAEASSIVMIWGSIIETSSTEQENQNNREKDKRHRFTPVGGARGPLQCLTIISAGGYDKVGLG